MSDDFDLKELRKILIRDRQMGKQLGIDELLLLLAEYIDDADVTKCVEEYVDQFDENFKEIRKKLKKLELVEATING